MGSSSPSSPIGFEGFEKRLEINFFEPPVFDRLGVRSLSRAQSLASSCTQTRSSSKLAVPPGSSSPFLHSSNPPICKFFVIHCLSCVIYSRGSFIFPDHQPALHRSFSEEVAMLNEFFSDLIAEAYGIGDPVVPHRNWHIYSAMSGEGKPLMNGDDDGVTLEMCMTGLEREKAAVFFKGSGKYRAQERRNLSGISDIIPSHVIWIFHERDRGTGTCLLDCARDPRRWVQLRELRGYGSRVVVCPGAGLWWMLMWRSIHVRTSGIRSCQEIGGWCIETTRRGTKNAASRHRLGPRVNMQGWKEVAEEEMGGAVTCPYVSFA
ncbi:hypothetical protein SLE2022_151620 [Rubroshorea leprosula]